MNFPRWFLPATSAAVLVISSSVIRADDWPQWLGPQRDSVWRESEITDKFPKEGPPVLWRTPVGGGYTGPAVAKGRVFLTDRQLSQGVAPPKNPFDRAVIPGQERALCLEEKTGKILWQHSYDCPYTVSYGAGPRATPLVSDGKVFTLGAEGNLISFEASSGKVLWQRDFKKDFAAKTPLWGFSGQLLLDKEKLFALVGAEGAVVVAFDKNSGKEIWRALTAKEPGYSSPILIEAGGARQLIVWHPGAANSLDPENGKLFWTQASPAQSGMTIATPRREGDKLLFTSFYNGSLMMKLDDSRPEAQVLWKTPKPSEKDTTHLNSVMSTPFLEGDFIFGVCSYGQLRCLKAQTGERVWETFAATTGGDPVRWTNAFLIKNGDRFFLPNEKGDLIIAKLSPQGYQEISRAHLLEPTNPDPGRPVVWSHPAFANRHMYARNDKEIICVDLAKH